MFLIGARYIVPPRQVNEPVVLLVKLFVTELTAELEARLVHLVVQLQAALRAQAFATPAARQAFYMIVTFGEVLLPPVQREKPAAGLAIEFAAVVVLLHVVAMRHGRDQMFAAHRALEGRFQRVLGPNVIGKDGKALAP